MSTERYRFNVGSSGCIVINDGDHVYRDPARLLFTNAPRERLEQVLRAHSLQPERWTEWVSPYPALLISIGRHRVLVDTGMGGQLLQNLGAEGIKPGDIDTVILTHAHPDHIGGNTDEEGKSRFRNARYVMWKEEWDFWTSEANLQKLPAAWVQCARKNLPPIQGQLDLIDRETEILPGVYAVHAVGHTPGHMAVSVLSGSKQFLYLSDAVLHPINVEQPDWYATVDHEPEQAVATRRRLLARAATDQALVHNFHFPFPGLGNVLREGEGWKWQPVTASG